MEIGGGVVAVCREIMEALRGEDWDVRYLSADARMERSVLASLWSVSDVSTADLMKRFYGYLREGQSKDEALRAAQADLIKSKDFTHPYHWAAFQLTGDWR